MKNLFTIDLNDYGNDDKPYYRPSARGIIYRDGKLALAYGQNEGYCKFPGGGIEEGEDAIEALIREVREEAGLKVIPESVEEFGSVLRRQSYSKEENTIFIQENFYFFCDAENTIYEQNLSAGEKAAGFTLRWMDIDEAIRINEAYKSSSIFNMSMIDRETRVLRLLKKDLRIRYLPEQIAKLVKNRNHEMNGIGMSDSDVYIFDDMVLKIQKADVQTRNERAALEWLKGNAMDMTEYFPVLLSYEETGGYSYTLESRIKGKMLCDEQFLCDPKKLVKVAASALRLLWRIDIESCNLSASRLDERLKMAREKMDSDPEYAKEKVKDFDSRMELLEWLEDNRPDEDLVFTHGDLCLPNILCNDELCGLIDLGLAGPADRYQDIAICMRSIKANLDGTYGGKIYDGYDDEMLMKELGMALDEDKYRYYLLLDELF